MSKDTVGESMVPGTKDTSFGIKRYHFWYLLTPRIVSVDSLTFLLSRFLTFLSTMTRTCCRGVMGVSMDPDLVIC